MPGLSHDSSRTHASLRAWARRKSCALQRVAFAPRARKCACVRGVASTLQVALFRDARLVEQLNARRRSEVGVSPFPQRPDDFLVRRDFDDLHYIRPIRFLQSAAPITDNRVP